MIVFIVYSARVVRNTFYLCKSPPVQNMSENMEKLCLMAILARSLEEDAQNSLEWKYFELKMDINFLTLLYFDVVFRNVIV